ncbi:hypothetical protein GCM10020358_65350 [Amorphoplanes nipponensis]|uniref:Trypsin-co-occurring domain-containing protein n=1 Tax=Actinoplanes nipponensis TaxID=135950 RepID=A0A919JLL4_9ACTN|nr:CU044_2847 family protein [Actinoplanes nipponensis]GIE51647.1 hypothetical protein Ani05nite_51810 [Actinoplanes nipponensis]
MSEIAVQVVADSSGNLSRRPTTPEPFEARIDELSAAIAQVAERLRQELDTVEASKDHEQWHLGEVQVQFGMALKAKTGILVVTAGAEATFSASLKWVSRPSA